MNEFVSMISFFCDYCWCIENPNDFCKLILYPGILIKLVISRSFPVEFFEIPYV